MTLSEDEVGIVNGEMFEAFYLPELAALSERYGGLGMHCCANARHQWEHFRTLPGLRLLNLCNPTMPRGDEYLREAYTFFAGTCVQMHMSWTPPGPPTDWPPQYPAGSRVVMEVPAKDETEAVKLAETLRTLRGK
jgi:hypothetical protein